MSRCRLGSRLNRTSRPSSNTWRGSRPMPGACRMGSIRIARSRSCDSAAKPANQKDPARHPGEAQRRPRNRNERTIRMTLASRPSSLPGLVSAPGEEPIFRPGDAIRIATREPIGHYRVPLYLRGKTGTVEAVIEPAAVDNEAEGYGRNAGSKRHYYRIAV